jgi:hypothetical protein
METAQQSTPEFQIGDRVPILEHFCLFRKPGLFGSVTQLRSSGQPLRAECNNCHKDINVDLRALESQKLFKNRRR